MTVTSTTKSATGTGNDSATTFSFSPIVIFESGDLVVTHVGSDGTETVLTEGSGASNYSVSVSSYPGTGSVVYPADEVTPMATGEKIVIKRVLDLLQNTDLNNQGGYFPDVQEQQFDKLVMIDLQQQEEIDRAFRFPIGYSGSISIETNTPAANKYLRVNSAGTALEWITLSLSSASSSDATPAAPDTTGAAGAGTNFSRDDHIHPLPAVDASLTRTSDQLAVAFASQAEAEAGTATDKALNALRVAQAITSQVPAAVSYFVTGDIKSGLRASAQSGWLLLNGDTLGDTGSGATFTGSSYQALYEHLWDNLADSEAPVSTGRGASAAADWAAGKTITMPDGRGRSLMGAGTGAGLTARTLGDTGGSEDAITVAHTHGAGSFAAASNGAHTHTIGSAGSSASGSFAGQTDTDSGNLTTDSDGAHTHTISGTSASTGSSGTDANSGPWLAVNHFIKL